MAALTLRDIPEYLQDFLRMDAAANHRSLNKQAIVALDEYRKMRLQAAPARRKTPEEKRAVTDKIAAEFAALPVLDNRSADEILGYDENGLPT